MEFDSSRRKLLQVGLVLPAAGFAAFHSSRSKENIMPPETEQTRQIALKGKTMNIVIEQVKAFTVMGLTYRFTSLSGGGDAGKRLIEDFAEEARYYGINADTTYSVTVEPSWVAGAKTWPPEKPAFYFTYGVAVEDKYTADAPFVFCLRRIPAGKYARVTVTEAEIGAAYEAFNPLNWVGDDPKPNWALSFQRSPSRFGTAKGEPPKQDFYISLGSSRDFILH
jgi:hypothetical protein